MTLLNLNISLLSSAINFLSEHFVVLAFYSAILLVLFLNRKRFEKHGSFILLLKTHIGIEAMDKIVKGHEKKTWKGKFSVWIFLGLFILSLILILIAISLPFLEATESFRSFRAENNLGWFNHNAMSAYFPYIYVLVFFLVVTCFISVFIFKRIKEIGYFGIFSGVLGFFIISALLINSVFELLTQFFTEPEQVETMVAPAIPGLEVAGQTFPLLIGWIAIIIIMIVHEGAHGIVARAYKIKVQSTGLAFFGPILGAFVEPDIKQLEKASPKAQASVYAAGPFANFILWLICLVLIFLLSLATPHVTTLIGYDNGVSLEGIKPVKNITYPAYEAGITEQITLVEFNGEKITNLSDFWQVASNITPNQEIVMKDITGKKYEFQAEKHPDPNFPEKGFMGVNKFAQHKSPKSSVPIPLFKLINWIIKTLHELFEWTGLLSLNIGLINLFPFFITDGAKILQVFLSKICGKKEKLVQYIWIFSNIFSTLVLLLLVVIPFISGFL